MFRTALGAVAGGSLVSDQYEAVDKFLLGLAEDICCRPAVHPEYVRLKQFVCNGDVDVVTDAP
jgi:hypothetical protein